MRSNQVNASIRVTKAHNSFRMTAETDKKSTEVREFFDALTAAGLSLHVLRAYDSLAENMKKDKKICDCVCMARKKLIFPSRSQKISEAARQAQLVLCEQQREFALRVLGVEELTERDGIGLQAVKEKLSNSLKPKRDPLQNSKFVNAFKGATPDSDTSEDNPIAIRKRFALFLRYIADAWRYQVDIGGDDTLKNNAKEFYELAIGCLIQADEDLGKQNRAPFHEIFRKVLQERKQQIIEQSGVTCYLSGLVLNYTVFLEKGYQNEAIEFATIAREFLLEHMDKLPEDEYRQVKSDVKKLEPMKVDSGQAVTT